MSYSDRLRTEKGEQTNGKIWGNVRHYFITAIHSLETYYFYLLKRVNQSRRQAIKSRWLRGFQLTFNVVLGWHSKQVFKGFQAPRIELVKETICLIASD